MSSNGPDLPTESQTQPGGWRSRIPLWPAFVLGGLLFVVWAWMTHWWTPITALDISQLRSDTVLPVPQPTRQISQTFVPNKDGLSQVEVLLSGQQGEGASAHIELQILDENGTVIANRRVDRASLDNQHPFTLQFPRQEESAGKTYTLLISGDEGNNASVWAYSLDVHEAGKLTVVGAETAAQDLRFVTRYQLAVDLAIRELGRLVSEHGGMILLALAMLLMPGCLLLQAAHLMPIRIDPFAWLAAAVALGASIWPLAWLWLSIAGGRWASWSLWLVLIAGWLATITLFLIRLLKARPSESRSLRATRLSWHHVVLLLILALGLAGRLLAVRDLAFPPWVDSSRHALITTVMSQSGQILQSYRPLLPVDDFPYHFGFHTLSAGLFMIGDKSLPQLLLILGQLINGLVPLTTYGAVYLITRRRGAGLLAAFLVALPFFFPAYYATWGRMTQITAVMVLPMAFGFTWLLVRGASYWRRSWVLVALLGAGLFLIHFRVFLLYVPYAGLIWLVSKGRHGRWLAAAGGLTLLLVSPHLVKLLDYAGVKISVVGSTLPGYNDFPVGYITVGWERIFLVIGAFAALLLFLAVLRRRRWTTFPLTLLGWTFLVAILLSTDRLGLPGTDLINLNSSYIVAFLPLALLLAVVAQRSWQWLSGRHQAFDILLQLCAGATLTAALLFGIRQQITILNPVTILAEAADVDGLAWLDGNLPEEATVAVNSWLWLGKTWAGSDGGAWIVPLTKRQATTPPADYVYNASLFRQVGQFNEGLQARTDWTDPAAAEWLRDQGVGYIYVGPKGGQFEPSVLARNPSLNELYSRDGVFIFEVK